MNKAGKDHPFAQPGLAEKDRKPNYGRGMRKLRGIMDLNQKEMAATLGMTSQQLSSLEKKDQWSDEMLQRVSEELHIPRAGLDYLANEETDLLQYVIQHNTFSDHSGGVNNNCYNVYNIGNVDKADEILTKIESLVSRLDKNTELMREVIPKKTK